MNGLTEEQIQLFWDGLLKGIEAARKRLPMAVPLLLIYGPVESVSDVGNGDKVAGVTMGSLKWLQPPNLPPGMAHTIGHVAEFVGAHICGDDCGGDCLPHVEDV